MTGTVAALVGEGAAALRAAGVEEARREAEWLLGAALDASDGTLRLRPDLVVDAVRAARYRTWLDRRVRREPLQYILGTWPFRELPLRVDGRGLIPRPETEELVGLVLAWAARERWTGAVADIGTGCGAIALSLAKEGAFARVFATDVSADALDLARENAAVLGLADRVTFRAGSLLAPLAEVGPLDAIVSNPPYVAPGAAPLLAPEIRDWEPAAALFAEAEGYAVLFALVDAAPPYLAAGGLLALEVGQGQAGVVAARMTQRGFTGVRIVQDLAGVERVVLGCRARGDRPSEGER